MNRYKTIRQIARTQVEVKKSRFITSVAPVETEEEAREFIGKIQAEFRDATHNVFAYQVGLQGEVQRMSDDGEPQGTSGPPVLEAIKKAGLTNVVVVVTRYFGGIMLGAGGLIRAYGQAAKLGLEAGHIFERGLFEKVTVAVSYSIFGSVQHYLQQAGYEIEETVYGTEVNLTVLVGTEQLSQFIDELVDLTNGQIKLQNLGQIWR